MEAGAAGIHLQPLVTAQMCKRKSDDDLVTAVRARDEDKKTARREEDRRKADYVRKSVRQRKHFLKGKYYCCSCDELRRLRDEQQRGSRCDECGHEPCPVCLVGKPSLQGDFLKT